MRPKLNPTGLGTLRCALPRTLRTAGRTLLGLPQAGSQHAESRWSGRVSSRFGAWWERHPRALHWFVAISLGWSALYVAWRIGFSLSGASPVLWVALLLAELYGCWNLAMLAWLTWNVRPGEPASSPSEAHIAKSTLAPSERDLSVDVYVCTYDEPPHVLEATLAGCALLSRPHTTYLLDDGRREEIRSLAERWGARWITRPDNSHAKAGNINHALPLTDGDLVLVLDADHVPLPDALDALCPHFADPKLALVQSPHDFSNHDSVQHYDVGRHEQSLFFSAICPGKDRHGAAFWCGSGALIRREALLAVGGVATETIAEDFHTTIKLHRAGWHSRYERRTVLQGKAPHDLAAYLLQRDRWARGNLAVFTTPESPFRASELTFAQRLSYLASLTAYFAGPVRLLLLGTLAAVLFSGALPLKISPLALGLLWAPATALAILSGTALCRGLQSTSENSHFELCTAEIFTRALRCVLRPGRAHFKVTPKEGVDHGGWESVRQFRIVLATATLLGLGLLLRVAQDLGLGFLPPMNGFAAWFVPLLGAIELRRMLRTIGLVGTHRQLRSEYRTPLETAAIVEPHEATGGVSLIGRVCDVTPSGIAFELDRPLQRSSEATLSLQLPSVGEGRAPIEVVAAVRSCLQSGGRWRIGSEIVDCPEDDHKRIVEYCHVVWPYIRLRGDAPEPQVLEPAGRGLLAGLETASASIGVGSSAADPSSTPSRERITATASGLLSIST